VTARRADARAAGIIEQAHRNNPAKPTVKGRSKNGSSAPSVTDNRSRSITWPV
jgi:hypothetical protein